MTYRPGASTRSAVPLLLGGLLLSGLLLFGCDLLGDDSFDLPSERLVAMTAVYEETLPGGRPVHRLVVADVQNPSNYEVLSAAGRDAGRSCFGPEKRRILFEDNSESNVGSRAPIKLLDLETREVRDLNAAGTLKGCVWRADGNGFYYAAGGPAGLTVSTFYDLKTDETEIFAQSESGATVIPYGRKGRDSILVLSNDSLAPGPQDRPAFYFVDAETGEYLTQIENGQIKGAIVPAYNDEQGLIAFQGNSRLTVSNLVGSFFDTYGVAPGKVYHTVRWGPDDTILADRRPQTSFDPERYRVMAVDIASEGTRELVAPERIDGAVGLRAADY
jgi:hypothetical protein